MAANAAPTSSRLTFDKVPPGKLSLRVAVEGIGSETLDSEIREATIPDFTSPQTVISTPEVFRARTAKELQQIKTDREAVPAAGRQLAWTDRLVVRIPAYGPGVTPPCLTVTARLLNWSGAAMNDVPVVAANGTELAMLELSLAGLATGEYLLSTLERDREAVAMPRNSSASGLRADSMRWAVGLFAFAATLGVDSAMPDATLVRFDAIVTDARGRQVDNLRIEDVHLPMAPRR